MKFDDIKPGMTLFTSYDGKTLYMYNCLYIKSITSNSIDIQRVYITDDNIGFQKEFVYTWSDKKHIINVVKDWKLKENKKRLRLFIKQIFERDKIVFSKGYNDLDK